MAPEIGFYHLTTTTLDHALPRLLERIHEAGYRAVVRAGSEERVEALVRGLWSYKKDNFLPHGSAADGHAERQPIYLTAGPEVPNAARVLVLVDSAEPGAIDGFDRVLEMFDGADGEAVAAARARWKVYQAQGLKLTYYQQTDRGAWQKAREVAAREA